MSDSILVMAPDGLFEFDESEIDDLAFSELGIQVLLKTGESLLLAGHEAAALLEHMARNLARKVAGE